MSDFVIRGFIDCLVDAIKNVNQEYYMILTNYLPDGITRERVFCYELYHQLRIILGNDFPYALHGELDKSGHTDFPKYLRTIPDFLVHEPGTHDENNVVIEVKGRLFPTPILRDFKKITLFLKKVQYKFGVFIIYNHGIEELVECFDLEFTRKVTNKYDDRILLIFTPSHGDVSVFTLGQYREILESQI